MLEANDRKEEALARSLAAQSEQMRGVTGSLTESVLLAVESLRHKETLEGNIALRRSIDLLPRCIVKMQHNKSVSAVAFSLDGQKLATASFFENTTRLWDVQTDRELHRLDHNAWVNAAVFSPDGQKLATASGDRTARLWTLDISKVIEEACSRETENMTAEEWGRFMDYPDSDCQTCPSEGSFNHTSI